MVKRGMLLSETKDGCALLEVDGKQYLLPNEDVWNTKEGLRAGMLVDVRWNADGVPERIEPAPRTRLETQTHSLNDNVTNNEREIR